MAGPELLGHSVIVSEEEVHKLIHVAKEVREPQPSNFTGRVAIWAEERELRGDSIGHAVTYIENGPHHVSWVKHEGINDQGETYCMHHLVCDCAAGKVDENTPEKLVEQLLVCRGVRQALQRRAAYVGYTYRTGEVLSALRDPETGDFEQPNVFHETAVKTVASILELDAKHPQEWPGNTINGEHRVSILATMFQLHPEVVKWYGTMLEDAGVITDFDGETLKLRPDALAA